MYDGPLTESSRIAFITKEFSRGSRDENAVEVQIIVDDDNVIAGQITSLVKGFEIQRKKLHPASKSCRYSTTSTAEIKFQSRTEIKFQSRTWQAQRKTTDFLESIRTGRKGKNP